MSESCQVESHITLPINRIRSIAADPDETLFPALVNWRNSKIQDLSYCIATFFNYLSLPRDGYLLVSRESTITSTPPIISLDMCQYLLKEIFPCPSMIKEEAFNVFRVPEKFELIIRKLISKNVANKTFFGDITVNENITTQDGIKKIRTNIPPLEIEQGVIQTIWTWISNGMDALAYKSKSNEQILDKLCAAESSTLNRRNAMKNYGFNDELENSAFQALLYVIVSITDWLETNDVGRAEVETAYRLIVPLDLQQSLRPTKSTTLTDIITMAFTAVDLNISEEAVDMLSTIMVEVQKNMEQLSSSESARRIINRFMAMAQPA